MTCMYCQDLCYDLEIVAMLTGFKLSYMKFGCFLDKWDNNETKNHYEKRRAKA